MKTETKQKKNTMFLMVYLYESLQFSRIMNFVEKMSFCNNYLD